MGLNGAARGVGCSVGSGHKKRAQQCHNRVGAISVSVPWPEQTSVLEALTTQRIASKQRWQIYRVTYRAHAVMSLPGPAQGSTECTVCVSSGLTGRTDRGLALCVCVYAQTLTITNCQLSGTLPDRFSKLLVLETLQLHSNTLSGEWQ